mmetsp:Transcript_812/g.1039  ORF Transcript_812/g.1039 Transcript_812/m.1039 type:complete len:421 (-) Transcript_812:166-1428(-)
METKLNCEEAILLDTEILQLLIQRNRKQHFRSVYFRRLDMVLRSINKYSILRNDKEKQTDAGGLSQTISSIKNEHDRIASMLERYKGIHRRRGKSGASAGKIEDEHWSLEGKIKSDEEQEQLSRFSENILLLHITLTKRIPEIISRIVNAASALYTELARGYFAPLCTVALGCISRIRTLLLRLGRDGALQLQRTLGFLKSDFMNIIVGGGGLEKQAGLSIRIANQLMSSCRTGEGNSLFESFAEIKSADHKSQMLKRKKFRILNRGSDCWPISNYSSDSAISTGNSVKDLTGTLPVSNIDFNDSLDPCIDIIGERIDLSDTGVVDEQKTEEKYGDRNLEMVSLLKEKGLKKSSKKRKTKRTRDDVLDKKKRKSFDAKDERVNKSSLKIEKKSKKKKSKDGARGKKKSKKSSCAIDDIFG